MSNLEINLNLQDYLIIDDEFKAAIESAVHDQIQGYIERKFNSEEGLKEFLINAAHKIAVVDITNDVFKDQIIITLAQK